MLSNHKTKEVTLPDDQAVTIETGKLAKQANGSVVVKMKDTMLLATVVSAREAKEGVNFMPLTVDYQEKFAATGRIPGGFLKREGRLSDYEVLVCRLVDRALRPLFPEDYHAETQVMISMISGGQESPPDALAALAASSAIAVSDVPFETPVSEIRVAKINGELCLNPSNENIENAELDIIVGGTESNITMVEGEAKEVSEEDFVEALDYAHQGLKVLCKAQTELANELGVQKRTYDHEVHDEELRKQLYDQYFDKFYEIASSAITDKHERSDKFKQLEEEYYESLPEDSEIDKGLASRYFHEMQKKACRKLVLEEGKRLDGRSLEAIRPIWCETDYLPKAHGSAVFTRGETQSLTTVTLGTKLDEQYIDGAMFSGSMKFMLHYNFPPFSTGEIKPNRGPGRREVGHGNLALRSLKAVMPNEEENPYTVRVVSDILESNGSSSMATVCAGSLALMDAGIKIKAPVSGIAMGLVSDPETGKYAVLSDILGDEDHVGDMDFKVAGTENGITACQMDIKMYGLSFDIMKEALKQANRGKAHIMDEMKKTMEEPRKALKSFAPQVKSLKIDKDQIGAVIGPGGKIIQDIQKTTESTVVIEEGEDHGLVNIYSSNEHTMNEALKRIEAIIAVPTVGETYTGKVKSIMPFGAFIEFMPGKDGLLHISEIKWEKVESMDGIFEEGENVKVKLIDIDKKTGKYKLSRKVLLPKPETQQNT